MNVSNGNPRFKGVSVHGQEPAVVKQGSTDSSTFKLHGKRYSAWDGDLVTLENAHRAFNQATLIHRVETRAGVIIEQTTNKHILQRAEDALNRVYKSLVKKAHKSKTN